MILSINRENLCLVIDFVLWSETRKFNNQKLKKNKNRYLKLFFLFLIFI